MKLWIPKFKYIPPKKREERPALRLPLYRERTPAYSQEDETEKQETDRGVIIIQM